MMTLVTNPTMGTVLTDGEYVWISRSDAPSIKTILMREDRGYYMVSACDDGMNGGEPSYSLHNEIREILGMDEDEVLGTWAMGILHGDTIGDYMTYIHDTDVPSIVRDGCRFSLLNSSGVVVTDTDSDFILDNYETAEIYSGLRSYHASHSAHMNEPLGGVKDGQYRIGVELEVEANTETLRRKITNAIKSNWLFMETDSSLADGRGIEFVTIPLLPKDAMSEKTWNPLVEYLKTRATSYGSSNCGLHIHIGREAFGKSEDERQATLGKLLYFYYECIKHQEFNTKVFGRRHTYSERDFRCKESEAVKVLGMDLMSEKKIRDKVDKGLKEEASKTRYYDINIQNAHTIEFRKGKGSICTERIVAIITYCDLMIRYCRKRDWMGMSSDDFLAYIRKSASKSSPLHRYLPTNGEEE